MREPIPRQALPAPARRRAPEAPPRPPHRTPAASSRAPSPAAAVEPSHHPEPAAPHRLRHRATEAASAPRGRATVAERNRAPRCRATAAAPNPTQRCLGVAAAPGPTQHHQATAAAPGPTQRRPGAAGAPGPTQRRPATAAAPNPTRRCPGVVGAPGPAERRRPAGVVPNRSQRYPEAEADSRPHRRRPGTALRPARRCRAAAAEHGPAPHYSATGAESKPSQRYPAEVAVHLPRLRAAVTESPLRRRAISSAVSRCARSPAVDRRISPSRTAATDSNRNRSTTVSLPRCSAGAAMQIRHPPSPRFRGRSEVLRIAAPNPAATEGVWTPSPPTGHHPRCRATRDHRRCRSTKAIVTHRLRGLWTRGRVPAERTGRFPASTGVCPGLRRNPGAECPGPLMAGVAQNGAVACRELPVTMGIRGFPETAGQEPIPVWRESPAAGCPDRRGAGGRRRAEEAGNPGRHPALRAAAYVPDVQPAFPAETGNRHPDLSTQAHNPGRPLGHRARSPEQPLGNLAVAGRSPEQPLGNPAAA
ncbi:hypothetical protein NRB56_70850 [Nocardia sp. RB56]|uniref:Uncharacterized protein n=1 Tax=Nocardia aurantia TaxID=2585199 RepID=A0A7K0E075_9NOCA|nr:hypothetical protein [Nocardia aurantia]